MNAKFTARKKAAKFAWLLAVFILLTPFDGPGPLMEIVFLVIAALITPWRKK